MLRKYYQLLLTQLQIPEPAAVPWSAMGLPLILSAIYLITFFMSVFLMATLLDSSLQRPETDVLVGASLLSGLLMIGFSFQYVGLHRAWLRLENGPDVSLWSAALVGFALAVLVDTIGLVLGVPAETLPLPLDGLAESESLLFGAAAFSLLIVRPIAAGIVFQGVWYPALRKQMPVYHAIGFSSAIFAILQYLIDPQYLWWGLVCPFIVGIVAGTARAATKSTQIAIMMHMTFGLFIVLRAILN